MSNAIAEISPYAPHPVRRPVMFQRWESLTFLHWRFEPEPIRRLLPRGLTLDTFEGAAWIGLTPFRVAGLRPPFGPAIPWISRFPETNVRTYVRGPEGERGVWFFTLEAGRLVAVLGARLFYRLPYRWSHMSVRREGGRIEYSSRRSRIFGKGMSHITIQPGKPIHSDAFDNFLTARFRLYAAYRGRLAFAQVEHEPWALQTGTVVSLDQTLFENSGAPPPIGVPVVHYSESIFVRIGRLKWLT